MVVKLLLCVSWSNTTTIDRKSLRGEQKHVELGNDGVPSTNRNIVNDTTVLLKRLNPIDSKANEDKARYDTDMKSYVAPEMSSEDENPKKGTKKNGGGGRHTWGKLGDEYKLGACPAALDRGAHAG